jgi:hypothetical protein
MFNKTNKEINDFTTNIKTIKNHTELLDYMNSSFYATIKLLISISSTFSIYWKVVLPFIISLSILLILSSIEPVGEQLHDVLNIRTNYILVILLCFLFVTLSYIVYCKTYLSSSIEKSRKTMKKLDIITIK